MRLAEPVNPADPHAYNSIYVIDHDGTILALYDKVHLVPFGEYLPFEHLLERLGLQELTKQRGGFLAGDRRRLITIPGAPIALPLICYEIIFPGEVAPPGKRPAGSSTSPMTAGSASVPAPISISSKPVCGHRGGLAAGPRSQYGHFGSRRSAWDASLILCRWVARACSNSPLPRSIGATLYARVGDVPAFIIVAIAFSSSFAAGFLEYVENSRTASMTRKFSLMRTGTAVRRTRRRSRDNDHRMFAAGHSTIARILYGDEYAQLFSDYRNPLSDSEAARNWRTARFNCADLISTPITVNRGCIGVDYHDRQEGAKPYRQTCRQPRAHAADDAWDEPGEARGRSRPDLSASAEIREGHQPHRRQPVAADFAYSSGAGVVLLRRRAERSAWQCRRKAWRKRPRPPTCPIFLRRRTVWR